MTSGDGLRVFIGTDAVGGVWNYSVALAAGLGGHGVTCCLAVVGPPANRQQRRDVAAVAGCELHETGLSMDWTVRDRGELDHIAAGLLDRAREFGATSLHLHVPSLAVPSELPTVVVAHSCVATWWAATRRTALPDELAWHAQATADGLANATRSVAPTRAFARALQASYPACSEASAIHNGLPDYPTEPVRRGATVLTAGRLWDDAKNMGVLDRAAASMRTEIHAAGPCEGPSGQHFAASNLHLLGNLPSRVLHDAMARAAIFAGPSLYEPFGLAVLEAARTGAPLVLADIPTYRELWSDAALFVPPDDAEAWAEALSSLAADETRRASLGQAARRRAGRYTLAAMIDKILPIHARLASLESQAA